jgi:hypothetical protein
MLEIATIAISGGLLLALAYLVVYLPQKWAFN